MTYKLVEVFRSIQGEGFNFGKEVIFVRFSGCNLQCPWCDSNKGLDVNLTLDEKSLVNMIKELDINNCKSIILTGGEPTIRNLQPLFDELGEDWWIGIETNGLKEIPNRINWISCSPKFLFKSLPLGILNDNRNKEFRLVVDTNKQEFIDWAIELQNKYSDCNTQWFLSPCAEEWNMGEQPKFNWEALAKIYNELKNKGFKISIQIHKLWNKR